MTKFSLATYDVKVASKPTEEKAPEVAPIVIDETPVEPKAPVVMAPAVPAAPEKKYKVLADAKVVRGGGHFILRAGKIISEHGYNIAVLRECKVQLEEVVQP